MTNFGCEKANFGPERGDFKSDWVDLNEPLRTNFRPERGRFGPGKPQGGTYIWTDGLRYGERDAKKFTPLSYRTSALWGRCPKREERRNKKENK